MLSAWVVGFCCRSYIHFWYWYLKHVEFVFCLGKFMKEKKWIKKKKTARRISRDQRISIYWISFYRWWFIIVSIGSCTARSQSISIPLWIVCWLLHCDNHCHQSFSQNGSILYWEIFRSNTSSYSLYSLLYDDVLPQNISHSFFVDFWLRRQPNRITMRTLFWITWKHFYYAFDGCVWP